MDRETQAQRYLAELQHNPKDLAALIQLERLFDNDWSGLVELLHNGAQVDDDVASARCLLEASRIADLRVGDRELGDSLLERAESATTDSSLQPELRVFRLAHDQLWDDMLAYFSEAIESLEDNGDRSVLYFRVASIFEEIFQDLEQADQAYQWSLDFDPRNVPALWARQTLAKNDERWGDYARMLIGEYDIVEDISRQIEILLDLGDVYRHQLDKVEEAAQCYANVYDYDNQNDRARTGLAELGYEVPDAEQAMNGESSIAELDAADLEPLSEPSEVAGGRLSPGRLNEDEDSVILDPEPALLDESQELAVVEGNTDAPVELEMELHDESESEVQELEEEEPIEEPSEVEPDAEESEAILEPEPIPVDEDHQQVAAEIADSDDLVAPPEELSGPIDEPNQGGDWETIYDRRLEGAIDSDGTESLANLVAATQIADRHNVLRDRARDLWDLAHSKGLSSQFWERTHFLVEDASFWNEQLETDLPNDVRAQIAIVSLGDIERGSEFGGEGIDEFVTDIEGAKANWRKFQRALEQRFDGVSEDEKNIGVYTRLANIARSLGEPDKEMDAMRRLDRAVSGDAVVQNRLKKIYRRTQKWPMVVDILKSELERTHDTAEKIDILMEMVGVYRDHMKHDLQVVNTYKEVLELEPGNVAALDELAGLYEKLNRSSDLVAVLQTKADLAKSDRDRVEIYAQIAKLFIDRFRNQAEAIKAYEKVLEIDPNHEPATDYLVEMYEKRREWEKLIELKRRKLEGLEGESRLAGLKEVAKLASDKLRSPEIATELWLAVREESASDIDALNALEALYDKSKNYDSLGDILEAKAELEEDTAKKLKLYQKMGLLFSDRLGDADRAIRAWHSALAISPDDLKSRKSLEKLFIDGRRWDELQAFYGSQDAHADLVSLLGRLSGTISEPEVKIDLLLRSARVVRDELGDPARAEKDLERVLELDPRNFGAAEALEPIYRANDNTERLRVVYEITLDSKTEPDDRLEYIEKLGRLHADELNEMHGAYRWFAQAVREAPEHASYYDDVERAADASGLFAALVETYQEVLLGSEGNPELNRDVRLRLGRVFYQELAEYDEALSHFQSVLDKEPENAIALAGLAEVYERTQRWDDLMQVYERRIELAEKPEDRVEILRGMAVIAEEQAGDVTGAISRHNEALEIDPTYEPSLIQLHRLYRFENAWPQLAEVIGREIAIVEERANEREDLSPSVVKVESLLPGEDDFGHAETEESESLDETSHALKPTRFTDDELERLIALNYELGVVSKEHLDDPDTAVLTLAQVLKWMPRHVEARLAIESFLDDADYRTEVAKTLETTYELHGDWESYVGTLEAQIESASNDSQKITLLDRIGETLIAEMGEPGRAFESFGRLLHIDPTNSRRTDTLRIAEALDDWRPLVALYEDVLPKVEDFEVRKAYLFDVADVYADRLLEYEPARAALEQILADEPKNERALEELEQLFTKTQQWRDLLSVLERQNDLVEADSTELETLRFRTALLWEEKLHDRNEAIDIYQSIRDSNHGNLSAIESLNRLFAAEGRWRDLASSLEQELELVHEAARNDIKHRLATVLEQNLDEAPRAVDLYASVLEEEPENAETIQSLERLMYVDSAPRGRIAQILEPLYIEHDRWNKLVEALEVQVADADNDEERVELLHRVAGLQEFRAQNPPAAFRTYSRALSYGVANEGTLENLYRIAKSESDYASLVAVFEDEADAQENLEIRRGLLRRAAAIYRDFLYDVESGAARLNDVLSIFPDDMESVVELESIYRQTQDWDSLVGVLVAKADLVDDEVEKKSLLHQSGQMYEEFLDKPDDAIDVYNRVLDFDGADGVAIDRLVALYASQDMWEELLSVYDRKVGLTSDPDQKKDLYYTMGSIHAEALSQPHDAIDIFRRILDIDETERAALSNLDALYQHTEQWAELLETLQAELSFTQAPQDQLGFRFRIGQLHEQRLYDVNQAIETYREILDFDPEHAPTRQALEQIVSAGEDAAAAASVLEPVYRNSEQWDDLIRVYQLQISATEDANRKVELYSEIGNTQEFRLADSGAAFQSFAYALQCDPSREDTLGTLERLASGLGGWEVLVDVIDGELENVTDPTAQRNLNVRIARIMEEELIQPSDAIDRLNRVLDIEPDDDYAISALDRLYQREARWADLSEILRTRISLAENDQEVLALRLRIGRLFQSALEQPADALDTYREILADDPENPDAIAALEEMFMAGQAVTDVAGILEPYYSSRDEHGKLINIYTQRLQQLDDREEIYDVWMLIANTFLQELGEADSALGAYGYALQQKPDDVAVVERIMSIAETTGAWQAAAEKFGTALQQEHVSEEAAVTLYNGLAKIYDEHLGRIEEAEEAYLSVLAYDDENASSLTALDQMYLKQGRWEDLTVIIKRRLIGVYEEEEVVGLNFRLANIYQNQLADLDSAADTYYAVLDVDPAHREALAMLEQIHGHQQDWVRMFDILERHAEVLEDPNERAEKYGFMAQIAEEALERPNDAVDLWNRVLQMRDDDLDALGQLRRLYIEGEQWSELVDVLEREVSLTPMPEDQLELYQALGQIWGEYLGNEAHAMEAWQKVLEIDPFHLPALEALQSIYKHEGDFVELTGVLARMLQLDTIEPQRLKELWAEQGEIQGDKLMDPDASIDSWRQVLAYDPSDQSALDNLERQYLAGGRWEEAAAILEMKLDTVTDQWDRIDLLVRIADLWETQVQDRNRAADFYEQIIEIDPKHEHAGTSLESIYQDQGTPESNQKLAALFLDRADQNADDPQSFLDSRRASAHVFETKLGQPEGAFLVLLSAFGAATLEDEQLIIDLERLAGETAQWTELVAHFENVLSHMDGSFEAAELHERVGGWHYERLGQPDESIYHLQRALAVDPANVDVMGRLENLYREVGDWEELGRILVTRVDATSDPDEQVDIWRRLGELYELQTNDIDNAISAYRRILEIDPSDILALESLERIYESYDRWTDLIDILSRKADTTYDPDDQVLIKFRSAQIWEERVGDVDQSIQTYRDVLAIDQTHVPTLKELERIYTIHQRWEGLLDVYEQQLSLTAEPDEQISIYGRQATLFEESFEDADRAIESYNSVLMIDPQNMAALGNLKRLFGSKERWFDFTEIVQRQAEVQTESDPASAIATWNELARTQRDQIGDPNAAIDAFRRSAELDPNAREVWSELGGLFEETANWQSAIECYENVAQLSPNVDEKVGVLHHVGFLYEANLQDDVQAENYYSSALEVSPNHQPSLLSLRDLYKRRGDWANAINALKQAEDGSRDLVEKANFLCEVGQIYEHQLEDGVSALRYYESALENDPSNTEAAEPLIDLYVGERRWERAAPLLDRFLSESDERDRETQHRRYKQHALVCIELGRDEGALESYRSAYELEPTDTETLQGLSEVLYRRGEWEQAFQILQTLQFNHIDALSNDEIVATYFKAGEVKRQVGEERRAIQMYQKALEYDPSHQDSIGKLIEVYEAEENWEQVINYTRAILDAESEPTVRFTLLGQIGDIWVQKLNRPPNATEVYLEALDIDPQSVIILRKLLDIFQKTRQWNEAVEILQKLVEFETATSKRAKYLYTIAVILRDEVRDGTESAKFFEKALDEDVKMLKAFEALDRIHTEAKAWKELERAYRRMIRRVTENDDGQMESIKILLWQNLGEIYRSRLNLVQSAIAAYETAAGLDATNDKVHLILAELYEKKSDNPDGAIEHHKALIKTNAFRIESYRALWKAYMTKKEYDKAWCMASALSFLQSANEQEEKFYRQYLGQNIKMAKGGINQEALKLLYHGPQDMVYMSMILGVLSQNLRGQYSQPLKNWGVHKKKDILNPNEPLVFCRFYTYVANTTGMMPAPTLYLQQNRAIGMQNANANPPAFIIGGDMMQNRQDRELMFIIAKKLAWARPEHYLGAIQYPTEFVRMLFLATMAVTDPSLGVAQQLPPDGAQWMTTIQKIPGPILMQLQKMMRSYLSLGTNPDLSAWMTHADHTSNRFGLLLCGDMNIAAAAIKNDMNPVGKASVKEKIKELVKFSISDEYFALRTALGLSIESR